MVVSGAVVSTVNERVAGVGSALRLPSIACTARVWGPSGSGAVVSGEVQGASATPSMLHWKVEGCSDESKVKVGVLSVMGPLGPERKLVLGGAQSSSVGGESGTNSSAPMSRRGAQPSLPRTSRLSPSMSVAPNGGPPGSPASIRAELDARWKFPLPTNPG